MSTKEIVIGESGLICIEFKNLSPNEAMKLLHAVLKQTYPLSVKSKAKVTVISGGQYKLSGNYE